MHFQNLTEQDYILRLEHGENIHDTIHKFAEEQQIKAAVLSGLGASNYVEIAHYPLSQKKYNTKTFEGEFEVTNITGNIALVDNKPFAHIHITLGKDDYNLFGGHLVRGIVSPTLEIYVRSFPGEIARAYDEPTGLKLLQLGCHIK